MLLCHLLLKIHAQLCQNKYQKGLMNSLQMLIWVSHGLFMLKLALLFGWSDINIAFFFILHILDSMANKVS